MNLPVIHVNPPARKSSRFLFIRAFHAPWLRIFTLAMACLFGCKTVDHKPNVALMQTVAENAAYWGTLEYLKVHPEQSDKFLTARASLRVLIAAGKFNADELALTLQQLPVQKLDVAKSVLAGLDRALP